MKFTIKEIEAKLDKIEDEMDPFLLECVNDERKGVQNLVSRWQKQQEALVRERERLNKLWYYEREARKQGFHYIAGVDEVGRGPLAGPVVAAAVILPEDFYLPGVNDSKQLSANKRELLHKQIVENALAVGISIIDAHEIDQLNIYEATKKAMVNAIANLDIFPDYILLDAMQIDTPIPQQSLVKGDALSISIACASIVAKVHRDHLMINFSNQYPPYQFNSNMGYGTKDHLLALQQYGPTPIHRKTFAPVKDMLK